MLQVTVSRRRLMVFVAVVAMVVSVAWVGVASRASAGSAIPVVYVATGENFPDALGAGPAAAMAKGPILLVSKNAIPSETKTELTRLSPDKIIIVGGTAVVSASVENGLKAYAGTVERIAGANRYDTAAKLSAATFPATIDADTLNGLNSSAFLGKTAKAADADKLDGKNSTVFVQKGEANSVSSSMVTDTAGVAQATVQLPIEFFSATVDLLAVQVEVPAAGYVLVQSTYMALIDHTSGFEDKCAIDVSDVTKTRPSDIAPHIIVPALAPTGLHSFVSAASRVYPVAGAGTYTFYLVGQEVGSGASCRLANTALTALFVPVAYGDI